MGLGKRRCNGLKIDRSDVINIAFIHENIAFNTFLRKKEKLL